MINARTILLTVSLALGLTGCSQFVKRDEFDSTISDLRSADAEQRTDSENLRIQLERMQARFGEMTENLQARFEGYDARIEQLQGRVRVDMTAHFDYADATLREQDKGALQEFSHVLVEYHDNVIITVEGFTDPAGDAQYNKWLGMERARSVRRYLIENGLPADKVRAVSYGEDQNRQIQQGAWGEAGSANRRVALVIDYVASS